MRLRRPYGFTVVEVLVALFVLSIVLAGLFSLTGSTLRFTGLTRAVSTSVEDIADAEGYLTDVIRNAKRVYESATVAGFSCDNSDGRCIAVVTPVLGSGAGQPIINFDLSIFSVQDIGGLFSTEGLERGWEGPGGARLALVEYRVRSLCASQCSTVGEIVGAPNVRPSDQPAIGFLLGSLAGVDGDGEDVIFFDTRADEGVDYAVEVTIVVRADARASQPYVVQRTPVALQVAIRP